MTSQFRESTIVATIISQPQQQIDTVITAVTTGCWKNAQQKKHFVHIIRENTKKKRIYVYCSIVTKYLHNYKAPLLEQKNKKEFRGLHSNHTLNSRSDGKLQARAALVYWKLVC